MWSHGLPNVSNKTFLVCNAYILAKISKLGEVFFPLPDKIITLPFDEGLFICQSYLANVVWLTPIFHIKIHDNVAHICTIEIMGKKSNFATSLKIQALMSDLPEKEMWTLEQVGVNNLGF